MSLETQDQFIDPLTSVIEPILTFFEMHVEGAEEPSRETVSGAHSHNPRNLPYASFRKFVMVEINAKGLAIPNIGPVIVATLSIRIDDTREFNAAQNHRLPRGLRAILNNFSGDATVTPKNPKNNRFAVGTPIPLFSYTSCIENVSLA